MRLAYLVIAPIGIATGLAVAPPVSADCTSAGGTTVCSQGDVRGANNGQGPGSGWAGAPSPCWWCNDGGGLTFIIQRPNRHHDGGARAD